MTLLSQNTRLRVNTFRNTLERQSFLLAAHFTDRSTPETNTAQTWLFISPIYAATAPGACDYSQHSLPAPEAVCHLPHLEIS